MDTLAIRTTAYLEAHYEYDARLFEYLRLGNEIFANYLSALHYAEPSLAFSALNGLSERRNDFSRSLFNFYGKDTLELAAFHESKKQHMADQPSTELNFIIKETKYLELNLERKLKVAEAILYKESARNYLLLEIEEVGTEAADQYFRSLPNGISYTKSILHNLIHLYQDRTDRIRLFEGLSYKGQLESVRMLLADNEIINLSELFLDSLIKQGELFNFAVIMPKEETIDLPPYAAAPCDKQ